MYIYPITASLVVLKIICGPLRDSNVCYGMVSKEHKFISEANHFKAVK